MTGGAFLSTHGGRSDTTGRVEQSYWHSAAQAIKTVFSSQLVLQDDKVSSQHQPPC
jgi:hypothetical protein